ncbi:PAM68 family protein [Synechococcus sp. M16CYN]|uniref:PAM68 family protein n=1 Tax=Synechococcus sp. M16CYN TaxID=3103139 RepID=UPI00324F9860
MTEQRSPLPFEPKGSGKSAGIPVGARQEAIPRYVANRMARRIAVFTGLPSVAGMGVFIASYFMVTKNIANIPPSATLVSSGFFFILGLVGLSVGLLTASWEKEPGSLLGFENFKPNLQRIRQSVRAQKQLDQK